MAGQEGQGGQYRGQGGQYRGQDGQYSGQGCTVAMAVVAQAVQWLRLYSG